jgi:catechol 2,3-dioxygenase-like lactoylglutathione lyase family enzyme
MYSHVTIGTNDIERAVKFYDAVMAVLAHAKFREGDGYVGYGTADGEKVWVVTPFDGKPASVGNGMHIAFAAPTRYAVDAAYEIGLANGGTDEGAPGLRPHYHPDYYGAYMRDPDGNKIQVVCHKPS